MSEVSEKEGSAAKAAAARLVEAEREITGYQAERERWINYTTDLQRIIEALCNRRGLPEPVSTARHHYEMAREYLSTKAEAALAGAEANAGEPVAWRWRFDTDGEWNFGPSRPKKFRFGDPEEIEPLYTHPAPQPIKRLEWLSRDCLHLAYSGFGTYRIEDQGSNWKEDRYWLDHNGEIIGKFPTLEAAKAAAQADYERRILSALTAGKPDWGAVREQADHVELGLACGKPDVSEATRELIRRVRALLPAAPTAGGGDAE